VTKEPQQLDESQASELRSMLGFLRHPKLHGLARQAVGGDEFRRHQADGMAELLELPGPVVGA